jgi:rhodanese-related sulfurtransferase/peroxiredoxin
VSGIVEKLLSWSPLPVGADAPPLSLTADDGTWIKLPDFKGHLNVLFVFFRSADDPETDAFLRQVDAARGRFEELDTAVFGVHTARTDELRAYRGRIGIEFFLLYDPFAFASRGFRASGRIRPFCKNTVVVVGKNGKVLSSQRGWPSVDALLEAVAASEGKPVPPPPAPAAAAAAGEPILRTPGQASATVQDVDSAQALALLDEPDSPYILVDVRTKAEFERDHSPRARHIPVDELPHRYQELGQTTHIVFVCQGGGRSASAAEFMSSIGATHVYNVVGGMSQWSGPRTGSAARGS